MAIVEKVLRGCSHLHSGNGFVTDEECAQVAIDYETAVLESTDHGPAGSLEEAPIVDDGDIEMVSVSFEFAIPDSWRSSNFVENKTNTDLYRGPKYLFIDVRKESSMDHNGVRVDNERKGQLEGNVHYSMKDQCIPCAPDFVRVRIDAEQNPMLASILYMNGDDIQRDFGANQTWVTEHTTPEGYVDTVMLKEDDMVVRDVYDQNDVMYDFDNSQFMLAISTHFAGGEEITWEDIRLHRNILLKGSDGSISDDMPQSMKDEVLVYRQLLRDLPTALSAYEPGEVKAMFPTEPNSTGTADFLLKHENGIR